MYVDVFKTAISVAGVAVALVASSFHELADVVGKRSAHFAVATLILCIVSSLVGMLALARGLEQAQSREREKVGRGKLNDTELRWILIPAYFALASFLVGLLFLGRMAFHV